jgi:hypothetical protein
MEVIALNILPEVIIDKQGWAQVVPLNKGGVDVDYGKQASWIDIIALPVYAGPVWKLCS